MKITILSICTFISILCAIISVVAVNFIQVECQNKYNYQYNVTIDCDDTVTSIKLDNVTDETILHYIEDYDCGNIIVTNGVDTIYHRKTK